MLMHAVSTAVGEKVAAAFGWNSVFAMGVLAAVLAIAISAGMREAPSIAPRHARAALATHWRALAPSLGSSALLGGAFAAVFVFFQPYALARGAREVNDFFIGFTATAVLIRAAFGHLGDRFGRVRVSIAACVVYAVSAASMIHLQVRFLFLYGALFGVAHGVVYPTLNAVVMERVGLRQRGRAMSLYTGAFSAGTAPTSIGWGVLADHAGYPAVYVGAAILPMLAAIWLYASGREAL